jgi:hypothetical protein
MTLPDQTSGLNAIPQELNEQMSKGNVVLFVGAGLSIGAGLPGWGALIRPLAERIGYTEDDLLEAAQYYENRNGRHALISHLRDRLDTTGIEPTENHDLLARLPINIVFTTNFDDLLERAYRKGGRPVNVVVGATELPFWDESRVNLVKLHGTYDRPDSFIITERDYNTIYRSNALIVQQLNALLAIKTFLFIGYSVSDPDFNQIYDQLSIDLGRQQRRPYLVTFDVDEFKMEDLERRGYHVISLSGEGDRNAQLAEWLRALLDTVTGPTSEAVTPPPPVAPRPQAKPTVSQTSTLARGGGDMDYERGLDALGAQLEQTNRYLEFTTLEARLHENLRDERLYGTSETSRSERARIINSLNRLALKVLGLSFNDLALGRVPAAGRVSARELSLVRQLDIAPSSIGIKPPVQARLQDLPFNELSWEQFEALCAALVQANPLTIDCHLYGIQGDYQQGIDVVATQRGAKGDETWAYQCKRYKEYTPGKLKEAVGKMTYPADYYVLMLSIPATAALRQVADEKPNIFLWDAKDIARKLKNYPTIVEDFFGTAWREAFCE